MKNDFVIPHRAGADGGLARALGDLNPVDVVHLPAGVANEMVVRMQVGVEPRGFALGGKLAHEAGLRQFPQRVIHGGPRDQAKTAIQRGKNLIRRGVYRPVAQIFEYTVSLGRAPEATDAEMLAQIGVIGFQTVRLHLILD